MTGREWGLNRLGRRFMWASLGVLAVAVVTIVIAAQQMFINEQDLGFLLWIMVPATVAAGAAAYLLSAPIARDASRLSSAAQSVAAGDLSARTGIVRGDGVLYTSPFRWSPQPSLSPDATPSTRPVLMAIDSSRRRTTRASAYPAPWTVAVSRARSVRSRMPRQSSASPPPGKWGKCRIGRGSVSRAPRPAAGSLPHRGPWNITGYERRRNHPDRGPWNITGYERRRNLRHDALRRPVEHVG